MKLRPPTRVHESALRAALLPAPASLEAWGKTWNVDRLTTDVQEIIEDPKIDIIDICTPNMTHTPLVIAGLNAGKHVICEKPLAPTPADIRQMIEARDKSGKLLTDLTARAIDEARKTTTSATSSGSGSRFRSLRDAVC